MGPPKRVVVLCDGTWCGKNTNTRSNIFYLASMMGIDMTRRPAELITPEVCAIYFDGVGMSGDFMSYLWNGALGLQARTECMKVYDFIVKHSVWDASKSTEIWLFGISRGAYIVRSVGGMINNCGIVKDSTNDSLISDVYRMYRSPYPQHHPSSEESKDFRRKASYDVKTPIKFMGLFDTVGSLGVPQFNYNEGSGFDWPQFHDEYVSSAVGKVYHAMALHDRFWAFQPFLAFRKEKHDVNPDLQIQQRWFPGCHYDLARQEFQFLREGGSTLERLLFPILNIFSNTIRPNQKLADLVLLWILLAMKAEGGGGLIKRSLKGDASSIDLETAHIVDNMTAHDNGSGDEYDHILDYLPGGKILSLPIAWWKKINATTYAALFNTVDRFIPDPGLDNGSSSAVWNTVYDFNSPDPALNKVTIAEAAGLTPQRYPSRALTRYLGYMAAVGRNPWG